MCTIDMATQFLILVSIITEESSKEVRAILSRDRQLLQTQVLRVGQVNKPYIGLTQENLIKNSAQDCLSYILKPYGSC